MRAWVRHLATIATLAIASTAAAQDPYGPGLSPGFGPTPSAPPSKKQAPKKAEDGEPEMHAASGGESLLPEGSEPALPDDPLAMSDDVRKRVGTSYVLDDLEAGRAQRYQRRFVPPNYFDERSGKYRLRTVFPIWVDRRKLDLDDPTKLDRASVYGGLYYRRRSSQHQHDVLFPAVWNIQDGTAEDRRRTTIVGPFVNRRAQGEKDDWLLPLYARGKRAGGGYMLVPPLLTYTERHEDRGFAIAGPGFCKWEGGPSCDARTAQKLRLGIAPLYFFGQDSQQKYEVIPPLLHYFRHNDREQSYTNVWGPYFRRHRMRSEDEKLHDWEMLHLMPVYWSLWGPNERHTTVLPLFHYGHRRDAWLFINPLFLAARGKEADRTFVTWGYARYRGRTSLDMVTPLVWSIRDPDIKQRQTLVFPFYYSKTSPRESTHALFPFYARSNRFAIRQTTWVTPFYQHSTHLRGWMTNLHPILYLGRNGHASHTVIAPLFFDLVDRERRATIGLPFYWRFREPDSLSQLVGNVYYRERPGAHGTHWQLHIFPLFSYGRQPDGHFWNLLYGLAGYKREGDYVQARALWIPIPLAGTPPD